MPISQYVSFTKNIQHLYEQMPPGKHCTRSAFMLHHAVIQLNTCHWICMNYYIFNECKINT